MAKQGKQKKAATRPGTPGGLSGMALRAPAKALAAILAVLHPAATDALFFVATGTSGHVFSKDYRQHLANAAAYRAETRR